MKIFLSLSAATALLSACASTPTVTPTPTAPAAGSAIFDPTTSSYAVTQNGASHALLTTDPRTSLTQNGLFLWRWESGGVNTSGYARATGSPVNADGTSNSVAGGLDNGTYFAGQTGTPSGSVPTTGTASYAGVYGFVVNGVNLDGPLALTANFGSGGLVDTSPGIDVIGTISGGDISGTVTIVGQSGTLSGMFINYSGALRVQGAAVGDNMAGVFLAQ